MIQEYNKTSDGATLKYCQEFFSSLVARIRIGTKAVPMPRSERGVNGGFSKSR